ncbi:CD109 antigen isoform X1 [Vombatus ursinus]|uniref:CD109 antigen isoform X1 n=1 Tax=Vombatus ursinus TaxID=29139 RepID=UPI000FFD471D|nr:CD109 antigen isoform X1 [Vombatus ursinus]
MLLPLPPDAAEKMRGSLLLAPHLLCLLTASWAVSAAAGPSFLVTTPRVIRPGINMTIGVELLEHSPLQVLVKAKVLRSLQNVTVLEAEGIFEKGSLGTLILPALPLNSANELYEVHVTGHTQNQTLFSDKTLLIFESKRLSVFIQTDKFLYKPKQEVKFRIVTLYSDLKPYKTITDILIKDPKSNLIQQWSDEQGDLGVISKTFQLSSNPILGDWSIQARVNGQTYYQSFQVLEYVLPKFEVTLQTPLYHSLNYKSLNGMVTAKYTYGKPVKGDVTLIFVPLSIWGIKKTITKHFEINGSANFTFSDLEMKSVMNHAEELHYPSDRSSPGPVEIIAVVTESLTGISRNASSNVFFKANDYTIEFFDYATVLKPSLNYAVTVKITRSDNVRLTLEEIRNNVTFTITQTNYTNYWDKWNNEDQERETVQVLNYTVPENGTFHLEFPILVNTSQLQVKASFLDSVNSLSIHGMFRSPSMTYIQLKTGSENVKAGSPFELIVTSNKPMKELSYMVISQSQLVAVGKKNSSTFSLTPENSWAPKACIIVYYVGDNGEIINDVLKVPVQLVFKNKITLSWNKVSAEPSENVALKVSVTQPGSLIGLVAVDKSVKLMNRSNDITEESVIHELELYNTGYYLGMFTNSHAVFQECGLWVSTDANLVHDYVYEGFNGEFFDMDDGSDGVMLKNDGNDMDLALAGAFPGDSGPSIRKHFPETWLWMDSNMGSQTDRQFEVIVPDSITSWEATAFVISEDLGLGMTTAPVELQAFQPFFIFLNLPYSVIRGEQFVLEVTIFNYLKDASEVTVTIETSDKFDILMISNEVNATGHQQSILVPSEDGRTVLFPIKPKHLGEIPITVTAISLSASDAITQNILVKAEGIEKSYSQSLLLDLTGNKLSTTDQILNFTFPPDRVIGSERIHITAIGDILGPSINGLESLIRMPYGCGEQNMINFAPNIYVLNYLTNTRQLTDSVKDKAISFMRQGYQRELLYQRDDGSFSAFGNDDPSGSTWLSAFVLRCFLQASPYIDIDQDVLHRTYSWLKKHKKPNGEFWEPGRVIHSDLQGGTNSPVTLTAYILTSLLGYQKYQASMDMRSSVNFLESQFREGVLDNYTLALLSYALSSVESSEGRAALDMLNQRAEHEGGMQFWESSVSKLSQSWQPSSLDIEVAAYALLAHFLQNRMAEGMPIMRWLSKQRNRLGGYSSTQDTIVALHALSTFAALTTAGQTDMRVTVTGPSVTTPIEFLINTKNRFLLQTAELAVQQPTSVTVSASGFGFAFCQLNVVYNVKNSESSRRRRSIQSQEAFDLDVAVKDNKEDINHLTVNVCTRFRGPSKSGMALMEVNLLSGFAMPPDAILLSDTIKKVENDHGQVNLYLDSVNETQFCVDIPAVRNFKVSNTQDASVSIVDYYEPRRQAVRSYNSKVMLDVSPCDLCDGEQDCNLCKDSSPRLFQHFAVVGFWCFLFLFSLQIWQ